MFNQLRDLDKYLYHYTSRETALEHILYTGKIKLNTYMALNDPRESKDWSFVLSVPQELEGEFNELEGNYFFEMQKKATKYIKGQCKVLCMSQDEPINHNLFHQYLFYRGFSKPRMWAQYSMNHTGVCLIFDKQLLKNALIKELSKKGDIYFGQVQYSNWSPDSIDAFQLDYKEIKASSLEATLERKIEKHYKTHFFSKFEDWRNENEWRCLLRGDNSEPEYVTIKESICGIVIGSDFPAIYRPIVIEFANKYSIELSEIYWPPSGVQQFPVP